MSWAEGDCCDDRCDPANLLGPHRVAVSGRVRGERRLGMWLTLPSYIVMILVTAYPLIYALVLSLYNYRLTDPAGRTFVGLRNYGVILTDPVWWNDFLTTLLITVVTVAIELVLGFIFAFVMLRIVRGRGRCARRSSSRTASSPWSRRSSGATRSRSTPASSTSG